MTIPDRDLGAPPGDEATWRTWWTSRVTAVDVYESERLWIKVRVPSGIRDNDYITIPAHGIVDLIFADDKPLPIEAVSQYRNFWTFPAIGIVGASRIYARVQDPSRVSSKLILLGPAATHEPYLSDYLTRYYLSGTPNGVEWVAHVSRDPPEIGWSNKQPDPRTVKGNRAVSLRFVASDYSGVQQALWIRDVPGVSRTIVRVGDGLYYDSEGSAAVLEARNSAGDLAVLLPADVDLIGITVTRVFRSSEDQAGAFEQLIFPLRSIAYAPASKLFRVFTENAEAVMTAKGIEFARNILLILASVVGIFAALIRRGPGLRSFLMFSLIATTVFFALNAISIWAPLYRLLSLIPGPPKVLPILGVLFAPFVLIQFVRVSVDVRIAPTARFLSRLTLGLGFVYSAAYLFFLLKGQFHIAENVSSYIAPVYLVAGIAVFLIAGRSKERGILVSFAAFGATGILTAVWASIFATSGTPHPGVEAATLILVCSMVFSLMGVPLTVYASAERSVRETNRVFRRFVPEEFLAFLGISEIEQIEVGHQIETELTLLFCDIRSFTSLSEKLSPPEVMALVNRYLDKVGPVIRENDGFVDKYLGDGIMAVFPGPASDACRAALRIAERVPEIDSEHELKLGIGLHRGPAMLGTIGDEGRIDTTVLSDAVNVASRLQSMTAELNATILVSATVRSGAAADPDLEFHFVDDLKVKGRSEPVETYELVEGRHPG